MGTPKSQQSAEKSLKAVWPWIWKTCFVFAVICANIGCDQATKSIVREEIDYHAYIHVVGDFAYLTKVENPGAFLSLGHRLPEIWRDWLLLYLPGILLLGGVAFMLILRPANLFPITGYCFMIGGGVGNLIDRYRYGTVTDFMNIGIGSVRTGIFNMADVSIMVGLGILLFGIGMKKKPRLSHG